MPKLRCCNAFNKELAEVKTSKFQLYSLHMKKKE